MQPISIQFQQNQVPNSASAPKTTDSQEIISTLAITHTHQHVKTFIDRHPAITKLFLLAHLFACWNILTAVPKLCKYGKQIVVKTGADKLDAAMKVLSKLGDIAASIATVAVGLEAFDMGAKLGKWGLRTLQSAYQTIGSSLDIIVLAGAVLSAAQIVLDGRKCLKTNAFIKHLTGQEWVRNDGNYTVKESALFQKYLGSMSAADEKKLGKQLGVNGARLRHVLSNKIELDPSQMKPFVETITGKLQTTRALHAVSCWTKIIDLGAAVSLFFPPLHPLAAALIVTSAVIKLASLMFNKITQYQFEEKLGLIDRPQALPAKLSWKERVADFTKWQVGWYEENSFIHRLHNMSSHVCRGMGQAGVPLTDLAKGTLVFIRAFSN